MTEKLTGLDLLREPFEEHQISKLPKPTRAQTDALKEKPDGYKKGIRCEVCGGWHHPKVVHLDYVGHAALTDRLLDCDPEWNWKPLANDAVGLPAFDGISGLWIELTVCGKTRIGYGSADGKTGGNAVKECIGDALRNAAMRFGAALDLWHKGDLHIDKPEEPVKKTVVGITKMKETVMGYRRDFMKTESLDELMDICDLYKDKIIKIRSEASFLLTGEEGEDTLSIDDNFKKHRLMLKNKQAVEAKMEEDMRPPE